MCCCFDLRRGVQVLGILFLICNIVGLVSNIISMNNTKTYYSNCLNANAAAINALPTQTSLSSAEIDSYPVMCDQDVAVTIGTLKYWDKVNKFKLCLVITFKYSSCVPHLFIFTFLQRKITFHPAPGFELTTSFLTIRPRLFVII